MANNITPALQPIVPAYHLQILSDSQLRDMKSAALHILAETGVHCPSKRARAIFAEHGAVVDFESRVVKIPSEIVLENMSHAQRFYTMGAVWKRWISPLANVVPPARMMWQKWRASQIT